MRKQQHRLYSGLLSVAIFAVCSLSSANAAVYSLTAIAGDTGVDFGIDGVFDDLLGGSFSMAVQASRTVPPQAPGEERRGVLEFGLSGVTGVVVAANINPDVFNFSTPFPDVEVYVYAGDGVVSLGDMTATGTLVYQNQVSSTPIPPIDVTDVLQDLISGGATHFGLRIQVTGEPNFITWANGLSGRYSTLQITTVPVPPAFWLLGSSLPGLAATVRRKRG